MPKRASVPVQKLAGRGVDRVGHQQMVAGAQQGQQRRGDRGLAGADHDRAVAALERGHRLLERERGRRAVAAVVGALRCGRAASIAATVGKRMVEAW